MISRLFSFGSQSSPASTPSSSSNVALKEETPEQEVAKDTGLKRGYNNEDSTENNNEESDKIKAAAPVTRVDDVQIDFQMTDKTSASKVAAGWIYPFEKKQSWPQDLQECFPATWIQRFDARAVQSTTLEKKMIRADSNRETMMDMIAEKASTHNQHVTHICLVKKDMETSANRAQVTTIESKIQKADERREAMLSEKSSAAMASKAAYEDHVQEQIDFVEALEQEYYIETPQKRMESAIQFRSFIMQEISRRAGARVARARMIASEMANAEAEAADIAGQILNERLQRAEVRRSIVLDRKRLAAGRHSNYVKSVYLTNKYMERRTAQMIQHNLDAAKFRRDVKLEEIKSNARQQNLSAQFRACCAYRLLDAKWLNYALKTTAAQTSAKMRRDLQLEAQQKRLHDAELRRADVLATHRLIQSTNAESDSMEMKLRAASERRDALKFERIAVIQERAAMIRSRKAKLQAFNRRAARKAWSQKIEDAARRRANYLARRRQACATRNWHAKILADRFVEELAEAAALTLSNWESKLNSAATRRMESQRPIFAELVSLRLIRAQQVLAARQSIAERIFSRKQAFLKLRLSALNQMRTNRAFDRLARVKRVQSNRAFMDNFYSQVIKNTMIARQRGAELRRSLYTDAIRAAALETIERSEAAQARVLHRDEVAREYYDMKMDHANARREEMLNEKIGSALWFLGKVAIAHKMHDAASNYRRSTINESLSNASLRRSIHMTRTAQANAQQNLRRMLVKQEIESRTRDLEMASMIKQDRARARYEAALLRKVEVARSTSTRVTVARLEKRAEDVVDAAIRTAIQKTLTRNAEERRQGLLDDIRNYAANQVSHARGVAKYQKELCQVRAEVTLEQSKLRLLQTTKRRENLMSQRKLGQSTMDQLQPYAGLQIVGKAMPVMPHTA